MVDREASAKGGRVRAERMTSAERSEAARLAVMVRWGKAPANWRRPFDIFRREVARKLGPESIHVRRLDEMKRLLGGESE